MASLGTRMWTTLYGVILALLCVCYLLLYGSVAAQSCPGVPWPAVDGLGRSLPLFDEVGPTKSDRFVGMFYFLWLGQYTPVEDGPFDISKILAADPDALKKPDSPLWGPEGAMHFWGAPLFGYYRSTDPWVLRRHAHLLADAGVDTLIFDATNGPTYWEVYTALCGVFVQVRREGGHTPQIAFMVNLGAGQTAQQLYNELYQPGLFQELWFYWEGKPLLICDPAAVSDELRAFFTLRRAQWPTDMKNTPYAWRWEAPYPQPYGFTDDPKKAEQVNVSAAQNLRASDGRETLMSRGDARGRSFRSGKQRIRSGSVDYGYNMQEQWKRVFELDPRFVMVTGWNEWIAGRHKFNDEPIWFCDEYNQEFSRDIEPARASHGDNYYLQLVANVRRFKGVPPLPKCTEPKTINIAGSFSQWSDVGPAFTAPEGGALPRDFPGVDSAYYTNATGRNEFLEMKVARDAENVYFYVKTRDPITSPGEPNWMVLLLNTDGNDCTGWEGYDFAVNRVPGAGNAVAVERYAGGFDWTSIMLSCNPGCTQCPFWHKDAWSWISVDAPGTALRMEGNEMHLHIPRKALRLYEGEKGFILDFKWTDNLQNPADPLDFYLSGDVAPSSRFRYRYRAN